MCHVSRRRRVDCARQKGMPTALDSTAGRSRHSAMAGGRAAALLLRDEWREVEARGSTCVGLGSTPCGARSMSYVPWPRFEAVAGQLAGRAPARGGGGRRYSPGSPPSPNPTNACALGPGGPDRRMARLMIAVRRYARLDAPSWLCVGPERQTRRSTVGGALEPCCGCTQLYNSLGGSLGVGTV